MEIKTVSSGEYKSIFQNPFHVYNTADFNLLNAKLRNVEIEFLVFKTKKYKLGIIVGKTSQNFKSPFSAPFGGFSFLKSDIGIEDIDNAIALLLVYCAANKSTEINFTLPPLFYHTSFISKLSNSLYRNKFNQTDSDLNYSIHIENDFESYHQTLHYNSKKNLAIALTRNFELHVCENDEKKLLAFQIIKKNRDARGFPLKLTSEILLETIKIIKADFFVLNLDNCAVAAAIAFHVSPGIVQVIYWGDLPEFAGNKTMNFLSFSLIRHYYLSNIKIIDIGPSTEKSIPNYGLCDFKESIGCKIFPKSSWTYAF